MCQDYYLGLDIGTNSVGWAVTDEQYELCTFKKKPMWGIRLFEEAKPAADRRLARAVRRRMDRRKARIDLLQAIFAEEMAKIDPTFFQRLNESRLHLTDKSVHVKYPLFIEPHYTDVDYYQEFPTIFHLRKALLDNEKPYDIRLVYLALHHLIKYRGHFLIEGDLQAAKAFSGIMQHMLMVLTDTFDVPFEMSEADMTSFEDVLRDKNLSKSSKAKMLTELFYLDKSALDKDEFKRRKGMMEQVCKLIVGNKGDMTKLFGLDKEAFQKHSFSFSDTGYDEEIRPNMDADVPEQSYILDAVKSLYDWSLLVDVLQDEAYLSFAKVKQYERHHDNLRQLRKLILKYCSKKVYNSFFNDENSKDNYAAYIGHVKKNGKKYTVKKAAEEDFYKALDKLLNSITPDADDQAIYEHLRAESELHRLLPLQKNKDNGAVPHQVYEVELKAILAHAAGYLPFLNEVDQDGYKNSDKIISIFLHRVPYYVGPLSHRYESQGANVWSVRKAGQEHTRIYPWNMKDVIDYEKSNEAFIRRMTNKCTYLLGEDVLPKNSLLYAKYMVLNELNNLKVCGEKVSVAEKQAIFTDLFMTKSRVTGKALLQYLRAANPDLQLSDLSGFDGDFKASLKAYLDFKKQVFGDDIEKADIQAMVEDMIRWITIYGDDKKMLCKMIHQVYPDQLTPDQIKKIRTFRYSGWGNFSQAFLSGVVGMSETDHQARTVIDMLWQTNDNLMQLLSGRYTFSQMIEEHNQALCGTIEHVSYETLVKDLYVSPANKRAIWQTIQIAEEIKNVMGGAPKRIFVEMARGEEKGKKKTRTKSRKQQLIELYANCKEDAREWLTEIESRDEREFQSIKLYLYYTQMGKCMYSGETIDLGELMSSNSRWDRDHIYPQSKIKDDSLDNLVLVKKSINAKKRNELLSKDIQDKMHGFWTFLLKAGMISKKKYDRLIRKGDFTDDELSGFIARQLVETRQSSKAVAELLTTIYPASKIIYVKAGLVSDFRKAPLGCLKSRHINDYHHAKDAYLNIVVGNVYNAKFSSNPVQWMKKNKENSRYSLNHIFDKDVQRGNSSVWKAPLKGDKDKYIPGTGTIERIRKTMAQDHILYTEYTYCAKGELFDAMPLSRMTKTRKVPLKAGLNPEQYGGYSSVQLSYFAMIEFDDKKGERQRQIVGVPIYITNQLPYRPTAFLDYCADRDFRNVTVLHQKIKKNALLVIDGCPMRIRGDKKKQISFKNNLQLRMDGESAETVRRIEKHLAKNPDRPIQPAFDQITSESLNSLYDALLAKMIAVYSKRPASQIKKVQAGRDGFMTSADLLAKAKLLYEMVQLMRCDINTTADLRFIGGAVGAGEIKMASTTVSKSKIILVHQSVTGLFEQREVL